MIERVSGDVLINTTIKHPDGIDHKDLKHPFNEWKSKSQALAVYSSSRRRTIECMDVHQIASRLKQAGITQDTIILVYHSWTMDLIILREFLESSGYLGILPSDDNCVPMLQPLRQNLHYRRPADQRISLALECLFPIMFPRHELVGLNHQALVDCQQTRLVCIAYDELCKPIGDRGEQWHPETIAKVSQKSILDWLQK